MGTNGLSWSMPVYVLFSRTNEKMGVDDDQIPPDGNPHPINGPFFTGVQPDYLGFFEDVGDLNEINQNDIDHGCL